MTTPTHTNERPATDGPTKDADMHGTPKQIDWAEKIKSEKFKALQTWLSAFPAGSIRHTAMTEIVAEIVAKWETLPAREWIDSRNDDLITTEAMVGKIEKWLSIHAPDELSKIGEIALARARKMEKQAVEIAEQAQQKVAAMHSRVVTLSHRMDELCHTFLQSASWLQEDGKPNDRIQMSKRDVLAESSKFYAMAQQIRREMSQVVKQIEAVDEGVPIENDTRLPAIPLPT